MVDHEFLRQLAQGLQDGTTHNPNSRASELKLELLAEREENERLRRENTELRESAPAGSEILDERLSSPALASRYGVDPELLRKRLDYWRNSKENSLGTDFTEVQNRSPASPKYLYRLGAVLEIVNKLKSGG